jgi:16S rRNA G966 N2-methylase RsmD
LKPVALVERAIRNSSKSRDIVLDPFGGSGTTLIAAERTGRRARLIELDPKYVDVIVERWQESTGGEARLAQTSLPFRPSDTTQHRMRRNGDENSRGIYRPIDNHENSSRR